MSQYVFHPQASVDPDEIWEFMAADNLDAADWARDEILEADPGASPVPSPGP